MVYKITSYSKNKAKNLGVSIKKSKVKGKKIAVFRKINGKIKKITDIGALGYKDYPTYTKTKGKKFADKRRRLYKIRHQKTRTKKGSRSYYADKILW
tara:strand:+ start:642 stop:932 length:291 start_codon:yes stop_codon:yes gene_type:complete